MTPWYATWLPWIVGVVAIHWLLPATWRVGWLIVAGAAFMGAMSWPSGLLAVALALVMAVAGVPPGRQGLALPAAAAIGTAFVAARVGQAGALMPLNELAMLGVAYYVLRAIHYLVDAWRGNLPPHTRSDVLAYMLFPPTLPLGPIHRFDAFVQEIRRLHWSPSAFAAALERLLIGYFMVVVVAGWGIDEVLVEVAEGFKASQPGVAAYLATLRSALSLYFRFAGYSHVAVGFALALGIRVMENFDRPLLATSLPAFWRRWHISLSRWCRDYVYVPIAAATRAPAVATFATMLVVGVWHGATPQFVAWGAYHGVGLVVAQAFGRVRPPLEGPAASVWRGVAWFLTLQYFVLGFVIVEAPSLAAALATYRLIFGV